MLHAALDRRADDILGAEHIGAHAFKRIVLRDRHVFQRSRVNHDIHAAPGIDTRVIAITEDPLPNLSDVVELPDGEIGELLIGGAVVSPEYKNRPAANAASKVQGEGRIWHRTGDLVRRDEQGRLWFCGRKAHRLQTPAGMVPAVPVEGVFNGMPGVRWTALVGVGPSGDERPVLLVEMEQGPEAFTDTVRNKLLARAANTRWDGVVQHAIAHPGFPVDARHNSKIKREELKRWAEQAVANKPALIGAAAG